MKVKYLPLILLIAISSCAPTIKNFDQYQKQFLSKSQFLPTQDQIEGKPVKIVVFSLEENANQVAVQAGLGASIANGLENVLTKNRLANLVDRNAALKLQKEIQLAEMNKTGAYKGPQIADYAISGAISNAGFTKKYNSASNYFDAKSQTFVSIPPSFSYKSEVSGNIKIYELPSMAVVDNVEFSGTSSRKENVQQNGGLSLGALRIGGQETEGANRDDSLVRKAGQDAVSDIEVDIKNILAKRGYILEKRTLEKKTIFKITLGSSSGLKHGDKLEIIGEYETENPITQNLEVERKIISEGIVTDLIDPKTSWIVLSDEKKASQIRLGDSVKMKYKKSQIQSLIRTAQKLSN